MKRIIIFGAGELGRCLYEKYKNYLKDLMLDL